MIKDIKKFHVTLDITKFRIQMASKQGLPGPQGEQGEPGADGPQGPEGPAASVEHDDTMTGDGSLGNPLSVLSGQQLIGALAHARLDQSPGNKWILENGVVVDNALYPQYAVQASSRSDAGCAQLRVVGDYLYQTTGNGYPVIFKTDDGLAYPRVSTPYDHTYTPAGDGYANGWSFRAIASFGDVIVIATTDDDEAAAVMRSDDGGLTWEIITVDPGSNQPVTALGFKTDGSILVATTLTDFFTVVWTSTDQGATWTERAHLTIDGDPIGINAIVFHGGLFVMPCANGDGLDSVFTAADPTGAWTENATPIVEAFVRWNAARSNGTLIVAVGSEDQSGVSGIIMSSPDGLAWTKRLEGTAGGFTGVTWSPELALWCAVGRDGLLYTSANGTAWTAQVSGTSGTFSDVAAFLGKLFAFDDSANQMRTSTNGTAWSAVPDYDPQAYYTPAVDPIGDEDDIFQFVRVIG